MEHMLDKDVERVLFSEEELHRRVAEIAAEIDRDYAGREPLLVSVLRGSFVFMADLVRQIHLPCTVDFMAVSSYVFFAHLTAEILRGCSVEIIVFPQMQDMLGIFHGTVCIMGHHDNGGSGCLIHTADQRKEFGGHLGIQTGGGLVQRENAFCCTHGPRQQDPLLLTA